MAGEKDDAVATAAAAVPTTADFRHLADAIPQLAWIADGSGSIFWYNRRWYDYTGSTLDDMRGRGWSRVHHPDYVMDVVDRYNMAFAAGEPWEDTFPLRRHDGTFRWFLSRAEPLRDAAGTIQRWFGTNTDITEQRQAEDAMRAAKEMAEGANRAKSQFIANMSHELRTPLSAVIGYSEMLAEEMEDLGQSHLLADLGKIESSARHLLGLINDVLDLSKIEAGRMTVEAVDFDVAAMIDAVVGATDALIARKGNRLDLEIAPDAGRMRSDELKIRQCLINLIGNAAKFTEGGAITLRARREGADKVVFDVEDTGIGMTGEQMERLFQRFSQADESTTRQFGGTGLGLAITKAFAERLGGEIAVESEAGRGSLFRLTLASAIQSDGCGGTEEPPLPPARGAPKGAGAAPINHILVVDDDPAARDLLARFLKREGFGVTVAADGQAGLALACELRPQAILLDVEMPKMDGWSVLHALRQDQTLVDTPVIMVSVKNEQSLAYALGATDYLLKPVDWDRLKNVIERVQPHRDGTVLVIDDDADARARMRFILSRDGWAVVEAADGAQALDRLDGVTPALILLDLMMPVMDGFAFLKRLRQRPDGGLVPVVVLTAKDVTPDERACLDAQAERIVSKGSLNLPDLAQELRDVILAAGRS